MTDGELRKLAIDSGAALWGTIDSGQIAFTTPSSLQTFALRIEAQAIKPEHQAKTPQFNPLASPLTCTLRIEDGRLVGLAWD